MTRKLLTELSFFDNTQIVSLSYTSFYTHCSRSILNTESRVQLHRVRPGQCVYHTRVTVHWSQLRAVPSSSIIGDQYII